MRPRILFVDDEPELLESIRDALRRERFRIFTAGSAAEALAVLEQQEIEVVVSDERMPGMSGSELLAEVYRRYRWKRSVPAFCSRVRRRWKQRSVR